MKGVYGHSDPLDACQWHWVPVTCIPIYGDMIFIDQLGCYIHLIFTLWPLVALLSGLMKSVWSFRNSASNNSLSAICPWSYTNFLLAWTFSNAFLVWTFCQLEPVQFSIVDGDASFISALSQVLMTMVLSLLDNCLALPARDFLGTLFSVVMLLSVLVDRGTTLWRSSTKSWSLLIHIII